jgi:hypothetical protein
MSANHQGKIQGGSRKSDSNFLGGKKKRNSDFSWRFLFLRERFWYYNPGSKREPRRISFELVFCLGDGEDLPIGINDPFAVSVYAVNASGKVVHHETIFHKATSVFRLLGRGDILRLTVFTNAQNRILNVVPVDCSDIGTVPGTIMIVIHKEHGDVSRHITSIPVDLFEKIGMHASVQ